MIPNAPTSVLERNWPDDVLYIGKEIRPFTELLAEYQTAHDETAGAGGCACKLCKRHDRLNWSLFLPPTDHPEIRAMEAKRRAVELGLAPSPESREGQDQAGLMRIPDGYETEGDVLWALKAGEMYEETMCSMCAQAVRGGGFDGSGCINCENEELKSSPCAPESREGKAPGFEGSGKAVTQWNLGGYAIVDASTWPQPQVLGCEHGRLPGHPCPHCIQGERLGEPPKPSPPTPPPEIPPPAPVLEALAVIEQWAISSKPAAGSAVDALLKISSILKHSAPAPGEGFLAPAAAAVLKLTQSEFDSMLEYSASLPDGTTLGKRWKAKSREGWRVGEYVSHPKPGYVGIRWYEVEIIAPQDGEVLASGRSPTNPDPNPQERPAREIREALDLAIRQILAEVRDACNGYHNSQQWGDSDYGQPSYWEMIEQAEAKALKLVAILAAQRGEASEPTIPNPPPPG